MRILMNQREIGDTVETFLDTVAAVGVGDVTPVTFGHMAWGKEPRASIA
ncbi:MAG: hypothetical protein RSH52_00180 [Janthinobacterium sp.]